MRDVNGRAFSIRSGGEQKELPLRLKLLRLVGRQTWIPIGQDRILRSIWNPDNDGEFAFEVEFFGMRYRGDLSKFLDWSVFAYGAYSYSELTLLEALAREIRKNRDRITFFDVGANVGHHTLFMASRADEVFCFEPYAPLQELIREKITLNRLEHIRIIPFALGDREEELAYYPGPSVNSGTGTFLPDEEEVRRHPATLKVRKGDIVCKELDLPRLDILKIDVEGFEPKVLRGLAERIASDRPAILTELTGPSLTGFGSEKEFRESFWEGAVFASLKARNGCRFKLKPFAYGEVGELLILPPEMGHFLDACNT